MKKINYILFTILLVIFASCSLNLKEPKNQNGDMVEFSLYFGDTNSSRVMRPGKITAENLHNVKVTFTKAQRPVSAIPVAGKAYTYYLPEGQNYDVMVEGIVNNSKVIGGTIFNVDRVLGAYVFVDLRYTYEDEYGKVDFTVDTSKVILEENEKIENVEAYLVRKQNSEVKVSYKLNSQEVGNKLILKNNNLIPAGIYELDIFYNLSAMPTMVPLKDNLVQVLNGQTTKLDIDAPAFSSITEGMQSYYNEVYSKIVTSINDTPLYIDFAHSNVTASTKLVNYMRNIYASENAYDISVHQSFPTDAIGLGQTSSDYSDIYFDTVTGNTIITKYEESTSSTVFYVKYSNGEVKEITPEYEGEGILVHKIAASNNYVFILGSVGYEYHIFKGNLNNESNGSLVFSSISNQTNNPTVNNSRIQGMIAISDTLFILDNEENKQAIKRLKSDNNFTTVYELPTSSISYNSVSMICINNVIYLAFGAHNGYDAPRSCGKLIAVTVSEDGYSSVAQSEDMSAPYYLQGVSAITDEHKLIGPEKFVGVQYDGSEIYLYLAEDGFYTSDVDNLSASNFNSACRIIKIKHSSIANKSSINLQNAIIGIYDNTEFNKSEGENHFFDYSKIWINENDTVIFSTPS